MSKVTLLTPPISPSPEQQNGHQPDTIYTPQPQAAASSIAGTLEDRAQHYDQGPPRSTPSTSQVQCPQCQNPLSNKGRVLILCFDGTGIKYGESSNIVQLFRALKKDSQKNQVLYYQPGIGTYNARGFIAHTVSALSSIIDLAIARNLDDHVKDAYKFLIQNYEPGDKICLFGFSRGAHTARVVAGMIYKIGVLPRTNVQQVDFAFNVYMTTGYQGYKFSREFKSTFQASHVDVEFVGAWDTVSSVGIIPETHPYTSINYSVKCFRHALALDERRTRFRPDVWGEQTEDSEQELDIDLPIDWEVDRSGPNVWEYTAPKRKPADVKEVWFAGNHSDVGGGTLPTRRSLSHITLRWMIKECILARTGIQFDLEYLRDDLHFDFNDLKEEMKKKNMTPEDLGEAYKEIGDYAPESHIPESHAHAQQEKEASKSADANAPVISESHLGKIGRHIFDQIFDQLVMIVSWWLLEIIPMSTTYQDREGNWIHQGRRNFFRGRYIPFYNNKIYVHKTVKDRIGRGYIPRAYNWDWVAKSPMLEYVP